MKRTQLALAVVLSTVPLGAQTPAPAPVKPDTGGKSGWNFELTPKAFQRNPALDMTVITEMTDAGRKHPPVSPQSPAYYAAHSGGYHIIGEAGVEKSLPAPEIDEILQHTLAARGYLPADNAHPPTLTIIYYWGAHNLIDQDNPAVSDEQWTNNILDRAALVGGEKFAAELAEAIRKSDALSAANSSRLQGPEGDGAANLSAAASVNEMNQVMNPVRLFKQRSARNEFLIDQASADCYYVIASAYDYPSVATNQKILLWRTRMTASSAAVSQSQSLPALISSAGPYFGREMAESAVLIKRAVRDGQVEVGTPVVVEPAASPSDEPKKN